MGKRVYTGRGGSSVDSTIRMKADILAMRDKVKRKKEKELESSVTENQKRIKKGKKPRTIHGAKAEKILQASRSTDSKIRHLQAYAAKMRGKAKDVERSGTGNKKAAATYRQVAAGYIKRIAALQKKK